MNQVNSTDLLSHFYNDFPNCEISSLQINALDVHLGKQRFASQVLRSVENQAFLLLTPVAQPVNHRLLSTDHRRPPISDDPPLVGIRPAHLRNSSTPENRLVSLSRKLYKEMLRDQQDSII